MRPTEVLAVVVSYNGLHKTKLAVEALKTQVGHVHIVDNGSSKASLTILDHLERESPSAVTIERLSENRGVGYALNRGIAYARSKGYPWLLTMDQDSVVAPTLVREYATVLEHHPEQVSLAPVAVHPSIARGSPVGGPVNYAITSGNLVSLPVFDHIGGYDEGFFIDCVDFDFSLRLRRAGYSFYRVSSALMEHQLGEPVSASGWTARYYALHPPVRRYYMQRNYMYLAERYFVRFPSFIVKLGILQLFLTVLVGFFDPSPVDSYRAIARGIRDYLARRTGPYPQPAE